MGEEYRKSAEETKDTSVGVEVVAEKETNIEINQMGFVGNDDSSSNPSWCTPKRLLAIFCVINLINYLDRGAIASNGVNGSRRVCTNGTCKGGSGIQGQFDLSNFKDGVVSSAFMVGLLIASPIFATLTKRVNPFRLIGVGLLIWTAAVVGCGSSWNFWSITVFRMLVGAGEASFISLAAPFIDDNAPPSQKTAWLGLFYMCIPVGYAAGYIYGGLVGTHFLWRWAFFIEGILMVPFVIFGFVMKPVPLKGFSSIGSKNASSSIETTASDSKDSDTSNGESSMSPNGVKIDHLTVHEASKSRSEGNDFTRFLKDMKVLWSDKVYVVNVLGYIAYNFVVGAYSYWGPKAGYNIYNMKNADMIFGGITVGCGLAGTIGGGLLLDYMNSTISNAFKLLSASTLLGAVFCFSAFCFKREILFLIFFAIGELLIFATQAPVNYVCLHCVKPSLRPLSMAMSTVSIHIFGDVPSAPLVGVLQDRIKNWRTTALSLTSILFLAALIWFIGIFFNSPDKFNEEEEENQRKVDIENANKAPLLEATTNVDNAKKEPLIEATTTVA